MTSEPALTKKRAILRDKLLTATEVALYYLGMVKILLIGCLVLKKLYLWAYIIKDFDTGMGNTVSSVVVYQWFFL